MPSTLHAVLGAGIATAYWTLLGMLITRRVVPLALAWPFAPIVGWSLQTVLALPIFSFVLGFSPPAIMAVAGLILVGAALLARGTKPALEHDSAARVPARVPAWAVVLAALVAIAPALAIVPKHLGDAIVLADPIFDHAKVALIDEMTRLGLPPGNPFLDDGAPRLAYYYLWHFSAAALARLSGFTGWEADIAMTWFAAFSSLLLMMGLAVWFSGHATAATVVAVLGLTASSRWLLSSLFGTAELEAVLPGPAGFGGWLFQSAWVPQHIIATSCVVAAITCISRLAAQVSAALVVTTVVLIVAGFESSTWIGGVVFVLWAVIAMPMLIIRAPPPQRWRFVAAMALTAALAAALAAPFIHDQLVLAATRGGGAPIVFQLYDGLGELVPAQLRAVLNIPAYWLIVLVVELPAIYLTGLIVLAKHTTDKNGPAATTFTVLALVGLAIPFCLTSTLGDNNDLGWRAILPAVFVLMIFTAVGVSNAVARRARLATAAAVGAIAIALLEGIGLVRGNLVGRPQPDGQEFAHTPELWARLRLQARDGDRVANNPLFLQHMTLWPVNLSWALLADRRSCFAGRELAVVYTILPRDRVESLELQFERVFRGEAAAEDARRLMTDAHCDLVVVTAKDAIWDNDPFAGGDAYRRVDMDPGRWRIYRRLDDAKAKPMDRRQ